MRTPLALIAVLFAGGCAGEILAEPLPLDRPDMAKPDLTPPKVDNPNPTPPPAVCGNGVVETGEQCDDGNLDLFDGCTPLCVREAPCPADLQQRRAMDPMTGHCYTFFDHTPRNYAAATQNCASLGGYPVTPTSAAETARITPLLGVDKAWMGYVDVLHDRVFKWVSGEPTTFTNWKDNEPNNGTQDEWCAWIDQSGEWDDDSCTSSNRFRVALCEIPPT